jgi:mono/diheme cytochrome c family protein
MRAMSIAALLCAMALGTLAQEQRSSQAMVYSRAQARDGARLYRVACSACHTTDAFVGPDYMDRWTGRSAAELFDLLRDGMPEEAPGSLSRPETASLLAYLFRMNGMPAGDTALGSDAVSLAAIRIEGPYKSK